MYSQFFGNYLLNRGLVTKDQLIEGLQLVKKDTLRLDTLAVHEGYMSMEEADEIQVMETHSEGTFIELSIAMGYLTPAQVEELQKMRKPHYLLLCQYFTDHKILPVDTINTVMNEYESEYEIFDLSVLIEKNETVNKLISDFSDQLDTKKRAELSDYLALFFNNLVRFIGDDFVPLSCKAFPQYLTKACSNQKVIGTDGTNIDAYLDMDTDTAVTFASRYLNEDLTRLDEYVYASLDDFLNLHNGIYIVSLSNEFSLEMKLTPPENKNDTILEPESGGFLISVAYSFGYIYFYFSIS